MYYGNSVTSAPLKDLTPAVPMPPPTTVPDLLDRVRRSGIVPADRLEEFVSGLRGPQAGTPAEMLEQLIDAALITRFHADKLAAGKYKGFYLGSYLILDQIGVGGMGQVFLAEHTNMQRLVALKVLPVFSSDNTVARERFMREARAAGTLNHPNIVRVFDLCQEGKLLYLVMEYVEGVSLQAVVSQFGPLPVEAACNYVRQIAHGLQTASELGFVHRDIKPANLLIDRFGVAKILDFGLVRSESEAETGLTRKLDNKSILGTADYVAPEQAVDSSRVDIRADIYSLGATLYYLLSGRPMFPEGRTAQKLIWQQIKDPVPMDKLRTDVPTELAAVIHRMIRKKADDRYQTPLEVFAALSPFVSDEVILPDPAWLPETQARVALSRAAVPSSQMMAASMGASVRGGRINGRNSVTDSGQLSITPPGQRQNDNNSPTHAVAIDETQRTPSPEPAVEVYSSRLSAWVVVPALGLILLLVLIGVVFLVRT